MLATIVMSYGNKTNINRTMLLYMYLRGRQTFWGRGPDEPPKELAAPDR